LRQNYYFINIKVEAREAVHSTRSTKSHANSSRICVIATQKDRSGCGACRMAKLYSTLERVFMVVDSPRDYIPKRKSPQGTGVIFILT